MLDNWKSIEKCIRLINEEKNLQREIKKIHLDKKLFILEKRKEHNSCMKKNVIHVKTKINRFL